MLEMLKSNVSFIMTTLERSPCILSYSCLFEVLFASLEKLMKKLQFIRTPWKPSLICTFDKMIS